MHWRMTGHLGTVAALCLGELIAAIILGAGMLTCVTGWSTAYIGLGAAVFAILLVLAWSLSFNHPKVTALVLLDSNDS